jgi:hypothetical protein
VNLWIKRAIGAAALGGGLLALSAGSAGDQEASADVSARLGRQTSVEVRVCADGRVLSALLDSCGQAGSGTRVTVDAGRDSDGTGVRARARVPASPPPTSRSAPGAAAPPASPASRRPRGPRPTPPPRPAPAPAPAPTPRPACPGCATVGCSTWDGELSLAGVGLLGSSPFTLAGDPAADSLLPTGELTLADLTGEAPAGIGVLEPARSPPATRSTSTPATSPRRCP